MASEDVIELGSSDDDTEPATKKKKPTPNAMVHFPKKIPGLTIKPAKSIPTLEKVLAGGAITIKNVNSGNILPQTNKVKPNGKSVVKMPLKIPMSKPIQVMQVRNNYSINPLSLVRNQQNMARVKSPKIAIPPGITVTRAPGSAKNLPLCSVSKKRRQIKQKTCNEIIPTVELDDEEIPLTSTASPQWYLRPEEQDTAKEEIKEDGQKNDMEIENNKEPDTSKLIEITVIEDSPVKPVVTKRTREVNSELAITIDDSPVKATRELPCVSGSDSEKQSSTVPSSKKRLDYPREDEEVKTDFTNTTTIEVAVEFEKPGSIQEIKSIELDKHSTDVGEVGKEKIEIQEHISKQPITSKDVTEEEKFKESTNTNASEFHPVYQRFIDVCFQLEDSDDMKKIVEKKIKTYYRQCPKEYVESEEFIDMVSSKIFAMKAGPDKMYLYIKDIVDELNLQRKTAKAVEGTFTEVSKAEGDKYYVSEETGYDSKRQRQIRKLEKTLKKLHRAIQKLEEQEVEFEDEEDSVYLLTERYKERMVRVHAKFCQLTNTKMPSEPRVQIEARPGQPPGPAKKLEKWINRKVPIGTPLPFPDFHDVLRCVRDANDEDKLGWNDADVMEEARDLFVRCGKKLRRRRQENEWRIAASRITHDVSTIDPAEKSESLRNMLEENKKLAAKKEIELLNKYADKQNQLKLVAEEIGDKEAEESPLESEEDEIVDNSNSLEDKQKRKERLRRLLTEKTRKASTEKETILVNEPMETKGDNELGEKETVEQGGVGVVDEKLNDKKEDIVDVNHTETREVNTDKSSTKEDVPNNDQKQLKSDDYDDCLVDSDIDELHLLQKLHSESEMNYSTLESTDSDTPIAISDTFSDSGTESVKKHQEDDIISIEDSSYSESEIRDDCSKDFEHAKGRIDKVRLSNTEVELLAKKEHGRSIEYDENTLLASSEEDSDMPVNMNNKHQSKLSEIDVLNEDSITNTSVAVHSENIEDSVMSIDDVHHDNDDENYNRNCMMTTDINDSNEINAAAPVGVQITQNVENNCDKIEGSDTTNDDVTIETEGDPASQSLESADSKNMDSKEQYNTESCDDVIFKINDTNLITSNKFGTEKVNCNTIDTVTGEVTVEKKKDMSDKSHITTEDDVYHNNHMMQEGFSKDINNSETNHPVQDCISNDNFCISSSGVSMITNEKDLTERNVLNDCNVEGKLIDSTENLDYEQMKNIIDKESSTVQTENHR